MEFVVFEHQAKVTRRELLGPKGTSRSTKRLEALSIVAPICTLAGSAKNLVGPRKLRVLPLEVLQAGPILGSESGPQAGGMMVETLASQS
jgi:hypothetical protein